MTMSDDDWSGVAFAQDNRTADTLAAHLQANEQWRRHYNTRRPHSSLGYRPPAPPAHRPTPQAAQQPSTFQ